MISRYARYVLPLLTAGALVFGCQGPIQDDGVAPDGFSDDGVPPSTGFVSVGVTSGSFPSGPCAGPAFDVHAKLALNGEVIRQDATEDSEVGADPILVEGVLTDVSDTSFTVDACALVDCASEETYEVTIDAGAAGILVPLGAFVRLEYTATESNEFAVVLTNLPTLEGQPNPIASGGHVWVEAMRGFVDDAPFTAAFTLTDRCWGTTVSARGMLVEAEGNPGEKIEVGMATTAPWTIDEGPNSGAYDVTNLSSYAINEVAFSSLLVVRH